MATAPRIETSRWRKALEVLVHLGNAYFIVTMVITPAVVAVFFGLALGWTYGWLAGVGYFAAVGLVIYGIRQASAWVARKAWEAHVPQRRVSAARDDQSASDQARSRSSRTPRPSLRRSRVRSVTPSA